MRRQELVVFCVGSRYFACDEYEVSDRTGNLTAYPSDGSQITVQAERWTLLKDERLERSGV